MERKGWLLVLGAVALIGAGAWMMMTDDAAHRAAGDGEASDEARGRASHAGGLGGADRAGGASGSARARLAAPADAGVLAQVPGRRTEPSRPGARERNDEELPGHADDVDRSSGWRLGQTRRRMAILTPRIERLRGMVEELEAQGNAALAERQRSVLERTERRMNELREEETELAAAARADGTMGDVDRGYEEGETNATAERGTTTARMPE